MTLTHPGTLLTAVQSLRDASAGRAVGSLVAVRVPVTAVDPVAIHTAARPLGASLWLQPDRDLALVGIGEAWAARPGAGDGRFRAASEAWSSLLAGARVEGDEGARGVGPLLLGGFSFDAQPLHSGVWQGFEPACLVLPSLLLTTTSDGAWLTLSWLVGSSPDPATLARTWAELVQTSAQDHLAPADVTLRVAAHRPEVSAWHHSVARLAGAVGRGRLDKAVLARRVDLVASGEIDVGEVVRRLARSAPESTLFAITRGARSFVGATPERLISRRGREFQSMAMAGSARRGVDDASDEALALELLRSDKEREEHAVVVAMLREALEPVVTRLDIAPHPEIVRFRHVQHLVTPLSGRLRDDADVLSLVERLHPTPAVGGTPRELALELIAEEEPVERGWYAGPLGWIDRHGDGEFVVALRSGVIRGHEASLFAGCGIVADSDPEREWDESSAKLLALGSALGRIEP